MKKDIQDLLEHAAQSVVPALTNAVPGTSAWNDEAMRRTEKAAIITKFGNMTIAAQGISTFESAVTRLLAINTIKTHWDADEFWSIAASLVVTSNFSGDAPSFIESCLDRLMNTSPALVMFPISNVEWTGGFLSIANGMIGLLDDNFFSDLASFKMPLIEISPIAPVTIKAWLEKMRQQFAYTSKNPAIYACFIDAYGSKAQRIAIGGIEDLFSLVILFTDSPETMNIFGFRGPTNRPGLRGITLDRAAIEEHLQPDARAELLMDLLHVSPIRFGEEHNWYSSDPFPLSTLLRDPEISRRVESNLTSILPVPSRIRIAAANYSSAFWSLGYSNAALRLGMALDALVGGKEGLPTRALAERYAFLESNSSLRPNLYSSFQKAYGVRSAIAHGGSPSDLSGTFIRELCKNVQWATSKMEKIHQQFNPQNEKELSNIFDALKWGTHRIE